jgi:transcriptional regulator with XRE-family HTH domain
VSSIAILEYSKKNLWRPGMDVIERILQLMKEHGVSGTALTSALEISSSSVSEWKKGKAKPSADVIVKIANYFAVSTDYLLTGKEYKDLGPVQMGSGKVSDAISVGSEKLMDLVRQGRQIFGANDNTAEITVSALLAQEGVTDEKVKESIENIIDLARKVEHNSKTEASDEIAGNS